MTIQDYYASPGSHLTDADARVIGPVLQKLAAQGKSDVPSIVEAARSPKSPLHPYVEWDDAKAAEAHREHQANYLAKSVFVKVVSAGGEERSMRAFLPVFVDVNGAKSERRHFLPLSVVKGEPDLSSQVLQDARRGLRAWYTRYKDYRDEFDDVFRPVFPAIENALDLAPAEQELVGASA